MAIISYFIGYKRAYDDFEKNLDNHKVSYQTFYATITDIRDTNINSKRLRYKRYKLSWKF